MGGWEGIRGPAEGSNLHCMGNTISVTRFERGGAGEGVSQYPGLLASLVNRKERLGRPLNTSGRFLWLVRKLHYVARF